MRLPGPNDSMLSLNQPQRREMSLSPPAGSMLSSGRTMSRMQDNVVQSKTRPIHSQSGLPIANGFIGLPLGPTSDTVGMDRSKFSLPHPSPIDTTGGSRTHTVLQGTISALKHNQQIVGLARIPGLQSLDRVVAAVQNILEVVSVSFSGYVYLACKILTTLSIHRTITATKKFSIC